MKVLYLIMFAFMLMGCESNSYSDNQHMTYRVKEQTYKFSSKEVDLYLDMSKDIDYKEYDLKFYIGNELNEKEMIKEALLESVYVRGSDIKFINGKELYIVQYNIDTPKCPNFKFHQRNYAFGCSLNSNLMKQVSYPKNMSENRNYD
ncbi:hypothetical protein [Vibrio paucivorans]